MKWNYLTDYRRNLRCYWFGHQDQYEVLLRFEVDTERVGTFGVYTCQRCGRQRGESNQEPRQ